MQAVIELISEIDVVERYRTLHALFALHSLEKMGLSSLLRI